jgi:hypothetical protein
LGARGIEENDITNLVIRRLKTVSRLQTSTLNDMREPLEECGILSHGRLLNSPFQRAKPVHPSPAEELSTGFLLIWLLRVIHYAHLDDKRTRDGFWVPEK